MRSPAGHLARRLHVTYWSDGESGHANQSMYPMNRGALFETQASTALVAPYIVEIPPMASSQSIALRPQLRNVVSRVEGLQ